MLAGRQPRLKEFAGLARRYGATVRRQETYRASVQRLHAQEQKLLYRYYRVRDRDAVPEAAG